MEHKLVIYVTNINNSEWMHHRLVMSVTNVNKANWMEHKPVICVTNMNLLMTVEFRVNAFTPTKLHADLFELN